MMSTNHNFQSRVFGIRRFSAYGIVLPSRSMNCYLYIDVKKTNVTTQ